MLILVNPVKYWQIMEAIIFIVIKFGLRINKTFAKHDLIN